MEAIKMKAFQDLRGWLSWYKTPGKYWNIRSTERALKCVQCKVSRHYKQQLQTYLAEAHILFTNPPYFQALKGLSEHDCRIAHKTLTCRCKRLFGRFNGSLQCGCSLVSRAEGVKLRYWPLNECNNECDTHELNTSISTQICWVLRA